MERTSTERVSQREESHTPVSLTTLSLVDIARCIARVRQLAAQASNIESFAQDLMQYCQETFRATTGNPEIVLSRCFVAQPFNEVAADVKVWLRQGLGRDIDVVFVPFTVCRAMWLEKLQRSAR